MYNFKLGDEVKYIGKDYDSIQLATGTITSLFDTGIKVAEVLIGQMSWFLYFKELELVTPVVSDKQVPSVSENSNYKQVSAEELMRLFDTFVKQNRDIIGRKGNDYSGNTDRLRNFKSSAVVKVQPENGILVRIMDKITRISELLEHDSMVKSESIEDTISDMSNYVFLLYALIKSKKE